MQSTNHLYVISNGSTTLFPDNSLTKFTNSLPNVFEFGENYNIRISVESIGFSSKFGNILTPENKKPSIIISICVEHCIHENP